MPNPKKINSKAPNALIAIRGYKAIDGKRLKPTKRNEIAPTNKNIVKICQLTRLRDLPSGSKSDLLTLFIYIRPPTTPWKKAPNSESAAADINNQNPGIIIPLAIVKKES